LQGHYVCRSRQENADGGKIRCIHLWSGEDLHCRGEKKGGEKSDLGLMACRETDPSSERGGEEEALLKGPSKRGSTVRGSEPSIAGSDDSKGREERKMSDHPFSLEKKRKKVLCVTGFSSGEEGSGGPCDPPNRRGRKRDICEGGGEKGATAAPSSTEEKKEVRIVHGRRKGEDLMIRKKEAVASSLQVKEGKSPACGGRRERSTSTCPTASK